MTPGQRCGHTAMETGFILACVSLRALKRRERQVYIAIKPIFTFSYFAVYSLTDFPAG